MASQISTARHRVQSMWQTDSRGGVGALRLAPNRPLDGVLVTLHLTGWVTAVGV